MTYLMICIGIGDFTYSLWDLAVNLKVVDRLLGSGNEFAVVSSGDRGGTVCVLGFDLVLGVDDIGRVDDEEIFVG